MVPLRVVDNRGPIPGEILFHAIYCHNIRYMLPRPGQPPMWIPVLTPAGPRFALVGLWYLLTARPGRKLPGFVFFWGIFRTLSCGGWTYITSTDDHDWHDILMISYIVATIPWMFGCLALSPPNPKAIRYRKYIAGGFFGTIIPLVYFFIQHKVHRVAGGKPVGVIGGAS